MVWILKNKLNTNISFIYDFFSRSNANTSWYVQKSIHAQHFFKTKLLHFDQYIVFIKYKIAIYFIGSFLKGSIQNNFIIKKEKDGKLSNKVWSRRWKQKHSDWYWVIKNVQIYLLNKVCIGCLNFVLIHVSCL